MIGRLAMRSLTAHPIRSAVLAAGFGIGVAVMAILLGVAGIVLEQAQSPALAGGGDVLIRLSLPVPARLVLSGTLQTDALRSRIRTAAASHTTDLFLLQNGTATRVIRGGGWFYFSTADCRCAFRYSDAPFGCYNFRGFRISLT